MGLRFVSMLVAVVAVWMFHPSVHAASPNVIMIVSDDHAWSDYGFMGHKLVQSPNLDRLARESLTFRRGYVTSSLCCPSLATIMTGRYPHQHKITSNDPPAPAGAKGKALNRSEAFQAGREVMNQHMESVPTMPRWLRDQGYLCLQTGKWWQGSFDRGGFTHGMTKGGRHGDDGLDIGRKTMQPIADHIDLAQKEGKPFFIWYAPMMPHTPHDPPERLLSKYQGKVASIHEAKYLAMIEWFDETIGQLLKTLDDKNLAKDTLVMYVADNGWISRPDSGAYAPKSKQSQYDGGLRSPIMVRWPGTIAPRMSDSLAQSIDFFPTLLHAVSPSDVPKFAAELPGVNLMDDTKVMGRTTIYGACFTHNANDLNVPSKNLRYRWMIDGYQKLIVPDSANEPKQSDELYDLSIDDREETNLIEKSPAAVQALRKKLDHWWNPALLN